MSRSTLALLLVLGLTACHGKGDGQKAAAGEVLSGSVSDAMLPLDATTSQPPHAAAREAAGAADEAASDAASGDTAAPAEAPAAQPN
ncbi:MAG: hypothetical protein JSS36_05515 [Proteobacteria bacterium]|nr:hypothetical protein [Pseudomonadota bacterium]